MGSPTPRPFTIEVPQESLDDLVERLRRTRWVDEVEGAGWDYGTSVTYLRELCSYWAESFDWRTREAELNQLPQFTVELDGTALHYVHVRGEGADTIPLLVLHGWPSTFVQMQRIIPLLARATPSFDVVVPSLPGYGFSARPTQRGMAVGTIARACSQLMTSVLGYERYGVRASDLGAGVAAALPHRELLGVHTSGTNPFLQEVPDDLSPTEQQFVDDLRAWVDAEFAYALEHSTKPTTPAVGLNDSPAGLAAWIVEKYRSWTDCDGHLERVFPKDDLLTILTIYWVTETIGSSMRLYYESMRAWAVPDDADVPVPTAVAMFPKDMVPTPREYAERNGPVDHWTDMPFGGHFGEWEAPELLAADLRDFFASALTLRA